MQSLSMSEPAVSVFLVKMNCEKRIVFNIQDFIDHAQLRKYSIHFPLFSRWRCWSVNMADDS